MISQWLDGQTGSSPEMLTIDVRLEQDLFIILGLTGLSAAEIGRMSPVNSGT